MLQNAFQKVDSLVVENASLFDAELRKGIVVHSYDEWIDASNFIGSIRVANSCCNEEEFVELDYLHIAFLHELIVGDNCLKNVGELRLVGLDRLEKVEIGMNCFCTSGGCFEASDCYALKSVRIGNGSCGEWTRFVIMNCGVEEIRVRDDCFVTCESASLVSECARGE